VVVFRQLTGEDLKLIVDIELAKVRERLLERGLKLVLTNETKEFLIEKGGDVDYGARPLRRSVESYIEDPLSEELLRGAFVGKNLITISVENVGDDKRLEFEGSVDSADEEGELAAVGSTEGESDSSSSEGE